MISSLQPVRIEVTRPYGESALSRILSMVEEAAARKAPAELFIRRFARIYTPVVTGLAVLIVALPGLWSLLHGGFAYSFDEWLSRALVFLVASCPCALVISIPLGYFSGIGVASKAGVLFKGGSYLDAIARVNTVVFDKTGTLTEGLFEVREVHVAPGVNSGSCSDGSLRPSGPVRTRWPGQSCSMPRGRVLLFSLRRAQLKSPDTAFGPNSTGNSCWWAIRV